MRKFEDYILKVFVDDKERGEKVTEASEAREYKNLIVNLGHNPDRYEQYPGRIYDLYINGHRYA